MTSVQWSPWEPWTFSVSLFGLSGQFETTYRRLEEGQVFAGYSWMPQFFIPRDGFVA